jgi:hypothetical protein
MKFRNSLKLSVIDLISNRMKEEGAVRKPKNTKVAATDYLTRYYIQE